MSLPRYSAYKDSGFQWLGWVPTHWTATRLKFVLRGIGSGGTPDTDHSAFWADEGSGTPWVAIGDLSGCQRILSTAKTLTSAGLESKKLTIWPPGTLLFSMYASLGHTATLMVPAATNQAILALLPAKGVEQRYLSRWLEFLRPRLREHASSNTQDNLNAEKVKNLLALSPPLHEQAAIATFLDRETAKIDALIAEQEKLIALLAEKRQATISHAVTRGLNPDAPMKDSGVAWLGEVPAHWAVTPLKYLVKLRSGGTPSKENPTYWNGDIPWASAKDLKVDRLASTAMGITNKALEQGAATLIDAGAVLVVVRGMILARTFPVVETLVPMTINQDLKALIPHACLRNDFLAWLLRGTADESLNRLDEAGHGTKALRMDTWTSMHLPVPPIDEQKQIAAYLAAATKKLEKLSLAAEHAISLLNERRSALIAAAVTGQIDVRLSVTPVSADEKTEAI